MPSAPVRLRTSLVLLLLFGILLVNADYGAYGQGAVTTVWSLPLTLGHEVALYGGASSPSSAGARRCSSARASASASRTAPASCGRGA